MNSRGEINDARMVSVGAPLSVALSLSLSLLLFGFFAASPLEY